MAARISWRVIATSAFTAVALCSGLSAQEVGGGGGFGAGAGGGSVRSLTRFEQFAGKLKLDKKAQEPLVTPILQDAARAAAPVAQQMIQLQTQMLDAMMRSAPDAQLQPTLDAYTAAAARMTGFEAEAFAKVYATLKPGQQGGATQAFDIMAGWFQTPPPAANGRGRRGGGL